MFILSRRFTAYSALAVTALSVLTAACYSWNVIPTPTPQYLSTRGDAEFRITTNRGDVLKLKNVKIRNDSIIGHSTNPAPGKAWMEFGLPTTEVKKVDSRIANTAGTASLVVLGTVVVVVAYAAATFSFGGSSASSYSGGGTNGGNWISGGSCPLVYSWDGDSWWIDSGTFGGAISPALARTDLDNLVRVRPTKGVLRFLLTDEANETEHVDAFTVLAVDHPVGTTVAPDAQANETFHVITETAAPLAAHDLMNREVLAQVSHPDGRIWESRLDGRNPANPAHLRDGLELTFARPTGSDRAQLVIDAQNTGWSADLMVKMVSAFGRLTSAWYDPATSGVASEPMRRAQHEEGFLAVTVWDGSTWRAAGEVWEAGPEVAKRQVLPLDLSAIPGDQIRVRLESAPAFWDIDYVGLGVAVDTKVTTHVLTTTTVSSPKYPDALARLAIADGRMLDMENGDTVRMEVRDAMPPARGMTRSYLARTTGWYRIHGRDNADPDVAMLTALTKQPHGGARIAVTQLNEMLGILNQQTSHALKQ